MREIRHAERHALDRTELRQQRHLGHRRNASHGCLTRPSTSPLPFCVATDDYADTLSELAKGRPDAPSTEPARLPLASAWAHVLKLNLNVAAALLHPTSELTDTLCDPSSSRATVDALWSLIHLVSDSPDRALAHADVARRRATQAFEVQLSDTLRRCALWQLGDITGFHAVPRPSLGQSSDRRTRPLHALSRAVEAAVAMQQLHLATAERICALGDTRAKSARPLKEPALLTAVLSCELNYERGNLAEVEARLRELLPAIRSKGSLETTLRSTLLLARASFRLGKAEFSAAVLRDGEEIARQKNWHRLAAACLAERIEVLVVLERAQEALPLYERLRRAIPKSNAASVDVVGRIAAYCDLAKACIGQSRMPKDAAARTYRRLIDDAVSRGDLKTATALGLRLVSAFTLTGDTLAASDLLEGILSVGATAGLYQTLLDGGTAIRDLLTSHSQKPVRQPHVDAYVAMLLESWPEPISHEKPHRLAGRPEAVLTARECKVLQLISLGHSNKRIAQILGIAPETVKTHAKHIFSRLGSSTRAEAVARGATLGLI